MKDAIIKHLYTENNLDFTEYVHLYSLQQIIRPTKMALPENKV